MLRGVEVWVLGPVAARAAGRRVDPGSLPERHAR